MIQYIVQNPNELSNAIAALNCTKKMFDFVELEQPSGCYRIIFSVYDLSNIIYSSELFEKFLQTKEAKLLKLYGELKFKNPLEDANGT